MLDQGCGREANPSWVRRPFLADTRASKLKVNTTGKITNRCILLMKFVSLPDTNVLIVNIELTKIKVIVRKNLKWSNLDYPSCHLFGRDT
jgi:hypothetical protein